MTAPLAANPREVARVKARGARAFRCEIREVEG